MSGAQIFIPGLEFIGFELTLRRELLALVDVLAGIPSRAGAPRGVPDASASLRIICHLVFRPFSYPVAALDELYILISLPAAVFALYNPVCDHQCYLTTQNAASRIRFSLTERVFICILPRRGQRHGS